MYAKLSGLFGWSGDFRFETGKPQEKMIHRNFMYNFVNVFECNERIRCVPYAHYILETLPDRVFKPFGIYMTPHCTKSLTILQHTIYRDQNIGLFYVPVSATSAMPWFLKNLHGFDYI